MTKVRASSVLLCLMLLTGGLVSVMGSAVSAAGPADAPPTSAPASRLIIDSESDFTQAVTEGRCSGSGTVNDPYVLEGESITWTSAGPAILVANVTSHFVIRDMVLTGDIFSDLMLSPYGIQIYNASNGRIDNCIVNGFTKNILIGTEGSGGASSGIEVSNCTITGPGTNEWSLGIELAYAASAELRNNTVTGCFYALFMMSSNHASVEGNNFSYNQGPGVWMGSSCSDNSFVGNLVACNGYGNALMSVEGSNNLFYGNAFITSSTSNQINIGLMMSTNRWNSSGGIGNYWGNQYNSALGQNGSFSGTSVDWNGQAVQTHYVGTNNVDYHPYRYIINAPAITDLSVGGSSITLSWSAPTYALGPDITGYRIVRSDGAVFDVGPGQLSYSDNMAGEWTSYNYTIMARSAWGLGGSSVSSLAQNPDRPSLEITSTLRGDMVVGEAISPRNVVVAWTGYDSDSDLAGKGLSNYWVSIDNGTWIDKGSSTYHIFDKLIAGPHSVKVRGEDADGNTVTAERYFSVYQALNITMDLTSIKTTLGSDVTANVLVTDYATGAPMPGINLEFFQSVDAGASYSSGKFATLTTDSEGKGTVSFIPTATSNYVIQARGQLGFASQFFYSNVSLTVSPYEGKNAFSVQSTSTVTDLTFSSSTKELRFTVSGESGTTGITKVFIAKSLVADGTSVNVQLDQDDIEYSVSEMGDYWVLTFTYTHSSHAVLVGMPTLSASSGGIGGLSMELLAIIGIVAVAAVGALLFLRSRRGKK